MPLVYQFQFQESLAMSSKIAARHPALRAAEPLAPPAARGDRDDGSDRALRQPEPRPSAASARAATISSSWTRRPTRARSTINLNSQSQDQSFSVKATRRRLRTASRRGSPASRSSGCRPASSATPSINFKLPDDAQPGFYHVFLRLEFGDGLDRLRLGGGPQARAAEDRQGEGDATRTM